MKQRDTTVLIGMLTMLSFAMGHVTLSVKDFWNEPVIVWMAIVLPTGKNFSLLNECMCIYIPQISHTVSWRFFGKELGMK